MPKEEKDRRCCACRVEWAMWGNINALYAGISESQYHVSCLYTHALLVIFAGGVLAASIPDILITDTFPTNVGSVMRYINMYPLYWKLTSLNLHKL